MKVEQRHFDAMMKGQKCIFFNGDKVWLCPMKLVAITTVHGDNIPMPFRADDGYYYTECKPIKTVRYLKEPVKMMKTLIDGGWYPTDDGFIKDTDSYLFYFKMFRDCGLPETEWKKVWDVDPSWIEEREE